MKKRPDARAPRLATVAPRPTDDPRAALAAAIEQFEADARGLALGSARAVFGQGLDRARTPREAAADAPAARSRMADGTAAARPRAAGATPTPRTARSRAGATRAALPEAAAPRVDADASPIAGAPAAMPAATAPGTPATSPDAAAARAALWQEHARQRQERAQWRREARAERRRQRQERARRRRETAGMHATAAAPPVPAAAAAPIVHADPIASSAVEAAGAPVPAPPDAGASDPPRAPSMPGSSLASPVSRRVWTREAIVAELASWIVSGTATDASFVQRHGPPGLVAAARRSFGRFDAALNVAGLQVATLYPDGPAPSAR